MTLNTADWLIILAYFVVSAAIGLAYTRRGSQSLADFFATGRSLPWWLAGTSMVATTFAADTPLAVAAVQPLPPAAHDPVPEPRQRTAVARDPAVREVTA